MPPRPAGLASGATVMTVSAALPSAGLTVLACAAAVACVDAEAVWSVQAKQANEFNGSPGNDLSNVSAPLIYPWGDDVRRQAEALRP